MRLEVVQGVVSMAMQAGRDKAYRELLAHLATVSGDGQGTRDDITHWVRCQLGEAKPEDRTATVQVGDAA